MSREIKFRAWVMAKHCYMEVVSIEFLTNKVILKEIWVRAHSILAMKAVSLDRVILEQYTGLKDKNGKEIYGGDIVKVVGVGVSRVIQSGWGEWQLCDLTNSDGNILSLGYCLEREYCEVIGNIHENPELLEDDNE